MSINTIAELTIESMIAVTDYLKLNTEFYISSKSFGSSKGVDKADRLISITNELESNTYINAIGGKEIYDKPYFESKNVDLLFLKPLLPQYKQFSSTRFV